MDNLHGLNDGVQDHLLKISQGTIPNSEIKAYGFGLKLSNLLNRKAIHHDRSYLWISLSDTPFSR